AVTALLAGDVAMLLLNLSSIEEHEKTGKARILAAAGDKRAALRPDLPTIAEAGGARVLDHRLGRAVLAGGYGPGSGGEDSRRRRQGFGIAAIARVLPRE